MKNMKKIFFLQLVYLTLVKRRLLKSHHRTTEP